MTSEHGAPSQLASELLAVAQDPARTARKRKAAAKLAELLKRPLLLGIFGEHGAGQFSLINSLFRHQICPPEMALGSRPFLFIRHGSVPAMFSINAQGVRYRLTSRGLARLVQGSASGSVDPRVIYKATVRPPAEATQSGAPHASNAAGQNEEVVALEIQLPLPALQTFQVLECATDQPVRQPTRLCKLITGRPRPEVAAWVTLATGAWKNSEHLAWSRLPNCSGQSLLLVTHCETLGAQNILRLDERLADSTGAMFPDRLYLSLKDAARLMNSETDVSDRDWQATGLPALEQALAQRSNQVRTQQAERVKQLLQKIDGQVTGSPRNPAA